MPTELFQVLTEAGPLAMMAGYLAWRDWKHSQRHDAMVERFQGQIDRIEEKRNLEEEQIRNRYDAVVAKYDEERRVLLEGITKKIETGLGEMRAHYARIDAERLARVAAKDTSE